MTPCKACGASLPEQARFCHQCGAVVEPEAQEVRPTGPRPELDFVQPALTGGAFLGLLSSLPLINAGNCLCCMWIIGGGSIATYMLARQQPDRKLTFGDGAFAGVASGVFGAIIATAVSIPIKLISARLFESNQKAVEDALAKLPEMEGPLRDIFMQVVSPEVTVVGIVAGLIANLFFFALFAMAGGILTVAILNRRSGSLQPPPRQDSGF